MARNEVVIRIALPAWSRRRWLALAAVLVCVCVSGAVAYAIDLTWIDSSKPLSSAKLKENLSQLDARLQSIEGAMSWAAQANNNISNTNTGNVGIGTTAPSVKLDVEGSVRFGIGTNKAGISYDSSDSSIGVSAKNSIKFDTANNNVGVLWIGAGNGNVGIGTTTPVERLEVKGTIKAFGALCTGNTSGVPNPNDCNQKEHWGRLLVDPANGTLYVCSMSGWKAK